MFLFCLYYLKRKQPHSAEAHPAVQRVQVRDAGSPVEVKDGIQAQDRQEQSQQHQAAVHQLPGRLPLTPGGRHTIHHSRCKTKRTKKYC